MKINQATTEFTNEVIAWFQTQNINLTKRLEHRSRFVSFANDQIEEHIISLAKREPDLLNQSYMST